MLEKTLSVSQVAERLRVHRETIVRWINTGRLRAMRVGSRYRIREVDVLALVKTVEPVHAPPGGPEQPPLIQTRPESLEILRKYGVIRDGGPDSAA